MACDGCKIGYIEAFCTFRDRQKSLDILESHGIRDHQVKCPECNEFATLSEDNSQWYCQSGHSFERSVSPDVWLENIHLAPGKRCMFMALYLQTNPPHERILTHELDLDPNLINGWSNFIREVLQDWCIHNSVKLGGSNIVIEMDEAELEKTQYYGGRTLDGKWVFTGYEKNDGNVFFEVVPDRTSSTLIEVIERRVYRGTRILLNTRMVCECLQREGFNRLKVHYDLCYVDPITKNYTRNAPEPVLEDDEKQYYQSGFIADFLFRKHFPDHRDRIHHFLTAVKTFPLGNRIDENDDDDTQMTSVVFFITCFLYAFIASYFFYRLLLKYHLYALFT